METEVRRGRPGLRVAMPFMAIVDQVPAEHGWNAVARDDAAA
ncbi:MAG TPA: hypothetical protein VFZ83_07945 [Acidimicrobiia bacterium]|nr:hypothetical protein [Acidimicrobiia bacterium]